MRAATNPKGRTNLILMELMTHNTNDWIVIATLTQHLHKEEDEINILRIALEELVHRLEDLSPQGFTPIDKLSPLERILNWARDKYDKQG